MAENEITVGSRIRIKDGWGGAGKVGEKVGSNVFVEQWWTPVLLNGQKNPEFRKTVALESVQISPESSTNPTPPTGKGVGDDV